MQKAIKILIALCILFCFFIALKTFFINRPRLSPGLTANFYLQAEQFGSRSEAEKYLFTQSVIARDQGERGNLNFDKVEILGRNYNDLKDAPYKKKEGPRDIKIREVKKEKGGIKVNLTETILREAYFFNFLLSKEYQEDGKIEFEVLLTKVGDWWSGYEWKVLKINSPTLIQSAKIGEETEIKKGVFVNPLSVVSGKLLVGFRNQSGFEGEFDKEYKISSSEWKIVGQQGQEIKPNFLEEKLDPSPLAKGEGLESGGTKEVKFEFSLQEGFLLKEIVFRNEGKEIHFLPN